MSNDTAIIIQSVEGRLCVVTIGADIAAVAAMLNREEVIGQVASVLYEGKPNYRDRVPNQNNDHHLSDATRLESILESIEDAKRIVIALRNQHLNEVIRSKEAP
jgi:hypothetical protein